ncbi:MAG TPA: FGGY-family carbohydrate kinase, partial [Clostridia bacterium]|nr:FGGY-family carbohydrate kinase [Clostridia bacterium]
DASGFGLFDVKERRWAYELIRKAGLDTDMFPDVAESVAVTGEVRASAAAATGIPAGTPVFGGGGDAVISTVGMGLALPGRVGVTLGTSGVVATGLERYRANPGGRLQLCCNVLPGAWHIFGCTLNAAGSYQWFKNALGDMETFLAPQTGEDAYAALDYAAQQVAPGADGLLFLPYLNGERCPHNDPRAKGAFVGLSLAHGKGHFARAVLEGVAFSLREVFELVAPGGAEEIVLAGGGAKSGLWRAIIADVFGLPAVTVYGSEEGGAYGAALVAGANPAMWGDLVRAMSLVRQKSRTLPEDGHTALYQERYAAYKRLYPALRDAGV